MPTDMADLAASIGRLAKQQNPEAYGEWDDAELGAQLLIQQQGQVHALFQSSNEKDPQGEAVVRPDRLQQAWSKAETIGAPGLGDRYVPPTTNEIMASDNPFRALLESVSSRVIGPGRPRSVAAADPYGLEAALEGKGHFPVFMGTVDEVGGAGRGLFSRVDDAVSRLPAKGAHPNKIAGILKSNASAEELAYRQVPEFLAAKGNATVTPAELAAHLAAHPAPMPAVKTLAASGLPEGHLQRFMSQTNEPHPNTPTGWVDLSERLGRRAQQWQRNGDAEQANRFFTMSEEAISMAEGLDHGSTAGQPKYAQYQLPGGNQYRETLLTLPDRGGVSADEIRAMDQGRLLPTRSMPRLRAARRRCRNFAPAISTSPTSSCIRAATCGRCRRASAGGFSRKCRATGIRRGRRRVISSRFLPHPT